MCRRPRHILVRLSVRAPNGFRLSGVRLPVFSVVVVWLWALPGVAICLGAGSLRARRDHLELRTICYAPRREVMVSVTDELRLLIALKHADETRRYKRCQPAPLAAVFTVMLDCGMRPGEVVRMRSEHVHLDEAFYFNPKG